MINILLTIKGVGIIKKLLLLLILTVILLIPCVSAQNITIDNSENIQDTVDVINNTDTINFNPGHYKQSGIKIDKDITLQGIGDPKDIIIDGENKNSIILVDSQSKLTIRNITFINAFSTTNGGAIKVNGGGHLTLENCIFINNTVNTTENEAMGGAVSVTGYYHSSSSSSNFGLLDINNCYFENNYAATDGGATNTFFATSHIYNSIFKNNYGARDCGGVNTRGTDITFLENCTFVGNKGYVAGAAIKNYLSEMTITNCTIINNTAGIIAGAITNCGKLTMTNSRVINNTAGSIASVLEVYLEDPRHVPVTVFNYNEIVGNYAPKESIAHIYEMGVVEHNFDYNYWGGIIPNSAEWNASFITSGSCPNPSVWLELTNSTINASDITRGYNSPYDFNATFTNKYGLPSANTNVIFNVNNENYTVITDENGVGKLSLKLNVGTYSITCINLLTNENVTKNTRIAARIIENKDITKDYLDSGSFKAKIIGDDGNAVAANVAVNVKIGKKSYNLKTDKKGYISKAIDLVAGKYTITATYKNFKVTNKIVIKPILKSKNVSVKAKKPINIAATLKHSNGKVIKNKKVTFKFKGKTYTAKTNNKGIAKITIKNTYKIGKYTIQIKYVSQTIKQTIKIKK